MNKKLCVVVLMAILMLWGCTPDEKKAEAQAPEAKPAVERVKDKAVEVTEAAKEKLEVVTEEVVEATKAVEDKIEKKTEQEAAVAVQEEKVEAAVKMEEKAASVVEKTTTTVESVVIDNKNGKVVLMHKKHAEAFGCAVCHGDQKPGPFDLGKEKAHALCQGCHKEKKAGPTSCTKCHQKKAKAVEGC
jgi:hypothetical protein